MTVWLDIAGRRRRVEVPDRSASGKGWEARSLLIDGLNVDADAVTVQNGVLSLLVEGRQYRCVLDGDAVVMRGRRFSFSIADPRSLAGQQAAVAGAGGPRLVKAPMPGRVVRILVEEGDAVEEQQGLIVIEAMKMQNELRSPKAGKVTKIMAAVGAIVSAGDRLATVE